MRYSIPLWLFLSVIVTRAPGQAGGEPPPKFEMTAEIQSEVDLWKKKVAEWAADKVLVEAIAEQNKKGPIADMTEELWRKSRRKDPVIKALQENATATLLRSRAEASHGIVAEAFASAAKGEKVAFLEKTSSYCTKANPSSTCRSARSKHGKASQRWTNRRAPSRCRCPCP